MVKIMYFDFIKKMLKGLFAAGDIANGPSTVASAVGSGRMAAIGAHCFLSGLEAVPSLEFEEKNGVSFLTLGGPASEEQHVVRFKEIENPDYHEHAARQKTQAQENATLLPFAELDLGFSAEQAQLEAARCMHCGHCIDCRTCVERCPNYILDRNDDGPFVKYPEECWHCACCRIGCPTGYISIQFPITMLV